MDDLHLGRDLTDLARRGKMDPVVGREKEISVLIRVLTRRTKGNPLLIGEPGVGKTALVDGFVQRMVAGAVPENLRGRRVFELQLGALLAGTQFRGDLEKRVENFLARTRAEGTIIFVDEIHLLIQAGRGSGLDAGNLLKPVLARGEFCCIGATTPAEAKAFFRAEPAFERRFQKIVVTEPDEPALRMILHAAARRLEAFHGLSISDEAIEAAQQQAARGKSFRPTRKNPDYALDLLEDACAAEQCRLYEGETPGSAWPEELRQLQLEVAAAASALNLERHVAARIAFAAAAERNQSKEALRAAQLVLRAEHIEAIARETEAELNGEGP
jgi:ATP-dependent Clp protease ATP-binding subunit ClpA